MDAQWMQRGLDALRQTLDVDDATKRDMIEYLFDSGLWDRQHLSWTAAVARFNGCLNPGKKEFFKLAEVWALMKHFGRYTLLVAIADDLGFKPLEFMPSAEREQAMMESLTAKLTGLQAEMSRLQAALSDAVGIAVADPRPLRMHPMFADGHGSFSRSSEDDEAPAGGF